MHHRQITSQIILFLFIIISNYELNSTGTNVLLNKNTFNQSSVCAKIVRNKLSMVCIVDE